MPILFLFDHLKDVQPFYQGLVRSRKSDALFKSGTERLSQRIVEALKARTPHAPSIPIPVLANYLANELFGLLKWWLDERMPYPPERMDEIFHQLVNPTLKSASQ